MGLTASTPHDPRLSRLDGEWEPPPEDVQSIGAAEDPCTGRGMEVAGQGLLRHPVTRMGWQALPAEGCHMARGWQVVSLPPG